jgi:hypothetical protein
LSANQDLIPPKKEKKKEGKNNGEGEKRRREKVGKRQKDTKEVKT